MRIIQLDAIKAAFDEREVMAALKDAFIAAARGRIQVAATGYLAFEAVHGDCHIKSGYIDDDDVFVVKIASSFHHNPGRDLSASQGLMAVISARTGQVEAILDDGGWLTQQRTALTAALVADQIARPETAVVGIVGAGVQARLQAQLLRRHLGLVQVLVWARDPAKAGDIGDYVSLETLCACAELIITATPSTEPLIRNDWIRPGMRLIAVGADAPGKQEIEAAVLARAVVIADLPAQCAEYGDSSHAVRAGLISTGTLLPLGDVLSSVMRFDHDDIVVADLTGTAIQDVAIARCIWNKLK